MQGLKIYSFFDYDNIASLLHAKYEIFGSVVYKFLTKRAAEYLKNRVESCNIFSIGIDDKVSIRGYAHNAIFLKALEKVGFKPIYNFLQAQSPIKYAGKNLAFREKNPRKFILKKRIPSGLLEGGAVLVDDIVTTGTTLKEAKKFLEAQEIKVHYAFVLSDADG
ncbi:MAG: phosphoribosyltransferase family protein [Helicobacter sp.]|nr:phosphoribosyltransferase family protein [Helicobacteraceae bacterium]MDY3114327.1 phosphoribosyltransferase family protein [Helicobacter sp.]